MKARKRGKNTLIVLSVDKERVKRLVLEDVPLLEEIKVPHNRFGEAAY
jgi:hypothetical protein